MVADVRLVSMIDGTEEDCLTVGVLGVLDAASEEVAAVSCEVLVSGYMKGVGLLLVGVCLVLCGSGGNVFDGCVVVLFCDCFH